MTTIVIFRVHEHLLPRLGRTAVSAGVRAKIQSHSTKRLVTNLGKISHAYAWEVGQINVSMYWVQFDVGTSSSAVFPKAQSESELERRPLRPLEKNGINNINKTKELFLLAPVCRTARVITVQPPACKSRSPRKPPLPPVAICPSIIRSTRHPRAAEPLGPTVERPRLYSLICMGNGCVGGEGSRGADWAGRAGRGGNGGTAPDFQHLCSSSAL